MKKITRFLNAVCIVSLLATGLVACGGKGDSKASGGKDAEKEVTAKTTEPAKPVSMRFIWWGSDSRHKATLAAIDLYKQKSPNVTIEAEYQGYDGYQQKIMTQLAAGSAPDLMQIDYPWLMDMASQKDLLMDLNGQKDIDLTQFNNKILKDFCTQNGKLLGLPMGTNGMGMIVNKEFMDKNGIALNTAFTWDSIIEQGKKIHDMDKNAYLFSIAGSEQVCFERYMFSKTGSFWLKDDYSIVASKADITESLSMLKKLFDSGAVVPYGEVATFASNPEQLPKWINGQLGAYVCWSGRVSALKDPIKDKSAIMAIPVVKDGKDNSIVFKPSMLLSINNASKNKTEAVKFSNWLLNDKEAALILLDQRSVPTSTTAMKVLVDAGKIDKDVQAIVDMTMKNPSTPPPGVAGNAEIAAIIKDVVEKVIFAKLTPDQGADEIIKRTQIKLDALKAAKK